MSQPATEAETEAAAENAVIVVDPADGSVPGQERPPRRTTQLGLWARKHGRLAALIAILVLAIGITAANALTAPQDGRPLSANNPGPSGAQAVARILGDHNVTVRSVDDFESAVGALSSSPAATLFLYDDGSYLGRNQLQQLKGLANRTVVVAPAFTTLEGLDAGLHQAGVVPDGTKVLEPACSDVDATAAGPIVAPSAFLYGGGPSCYPAGSDTNNDTNNNAAGVVAHSSTGDLIVLGSEQLLSNRTLAQEGNAALAVRTLGNTSTLVWYLPGIRDFDSPGAPRTLGELAPAWTGFLGPWLILVTALAMVWRGRRLGPLVFEPLPVTVKAGETLYGRARLYQEARAVALAGDNLRAGTLVRLSRHFRLGPDASAADVATRAAMVLGRPDAAVLELLDKSPADEGRLVQWAQELNKLEQEVAERG